MVTDKDLHSKNLLLSVPPFVLLSTYRINAVEAHCYVVQYRRIDLSNDVRSRINQSTDCRTFWPHTYVGLRQLQTTLS